MVPPLREPPQENDKSGRYSPNGMSERSTLELGMCRRGCPRARSGSSTLDLQAGVGEPSFLFVDLYEFLDEFFERFVFFTVVLQSLCEVVTEFDCSWHT